MAGKRSARSGITARRDSSRTHEDRGPGNARATFHGFSAERGRQRRDRINEFVGRPKRWLGAENFTSRRTDSRNRGRSRSHSFSVGESLGLGTALDFVGLIGLRSVFHITWA